MEMLYYTVAAVILYLVSDYILNAIEIKMGKRLPQRSFYFFILITILALKTFSFIRAIYAPLPNKQQPTSTVEKTEKKTTPNQPFSTGNENKK